MAKILIVDDDRLNLALTREVLERQGHSVVEAKSGEEAVCMAASSRPDLIVMDIMMPGMGGIAALEKLRKNNSVSHLPVIALTALAMPGDKQRILACGFDAYVPKPIKVLSFARQVQSLLDGTA